MLAAVGGFVLTRDDVLMSNDLYPSMSMESSRRKFVTPRFCNPCIDFSQAPEHVEGEGL
jgi:hypothetical protein